MSNSEIVTFQKPGALMEYLKKASSAVAMALPKHLNPDRMLRLAVTAFSTTPDLRTCSGQSILSSIIVASQLGLEPGIAGQGYLVPYGTTCTFIPGWQGLVGLLNNTGRATAWTGVVYEGDEWEFELGSRPVCRHRPGDNFGDEAKITHFYACGKVNGSEQPIVEVWTSARAKKHRDKFNKQGQKHYSFKNWEMYGRKVVLLQVLKYLPRSIELNTALKITDAEQMNAPTKFEDGMVVEMGPVEDTGGGASEPVFNESRSEIPKSAAKKAAPKAEEQATFAGAEESPRAAFQRLYRAENFSEAEMTAWARSVSMLGADEELPAISENNLRMIVEDWGNAKDQIIQAWQAKG